MSELNSKEFHPELVHHYLSDENWTDSDTPLFKELKSFDEYYCDKELHASGGMKDIFKIRDLRTNRFVAMAEIKDKGENAELSFEQFLREARIAAALEHPNILPVYDIGINKQDIPFFTMKLMTGSSLHRILREKIKLNPFYASRFDRSFFLELFVKVCEAVSYAHSRRVIHLDIKPANIMVGDYGEAYVCDWGLAKIIDSSIPELQEISTLDAGILNDITLYGEVKGTPGFMAPEQIDKKFGSKCEKTDIYALGALLYSMLTFQRPLSKLSSELTLKRTVSGEILPPKLISDNIPESLNAICVKAMALQQSDRYESVEELLVDLRSYQDGFATQAENATPLKLFYLLLKRNKWIFIMLLMIVVTGAVVGGVSGSLLMKNKMEAERKITSIQQLAGELETQLAEEKGKFIIDSDRLKRAKSIRGSSIKLNGVNQYLGNTKLPFHSGTVSFWFKPEKTKSSYPKFFQLGNSRWHIHNGSKNWSGGLVSTEGKALVSPLAMGGTLWSKWHHFAITVDQSGKTKFYIDGIELLIKMKFSGERTLILANWFVNGAEHLLKCSFDELSVWNRVLKREEIMEVANHELNGDEAGLIGYYPFDGDTENKASNSWHLETSGNPTFVK